MKKSEMYCGYCGHTDEIILTSIPPKVKCLITGECHNLGADCNIELAPVKHGHWIHVSGSEPYDEYVCSVCGTKASSFIGGTEMWYCLSKPNYCPTCGAIMDEKENDNG